MNREDAGKYIDRMKFIDVYELGECVSVYPFNRRDCHIIYSEDCYILVNGTHVSNWLYEEAVEALKELPSPKEMGVLVKKFKKMRAFI